MKRILLMTFAALFVAGFAFATDEMGLYTDVNHIGYTMGPNYTLYVFVHMVDNTVSATEFKLVFPTHAARNGGVTNGPRISFNIPTPDIEHDIAFAFNQIDESTCYGDWEEVCHMNVSVTAGGAGEVITIAAGDFADPHVIQVAICDGTIIEPTIIRTVVQTENATWSHIKSLF